MRAIGHAAVAIFALAGHVDLAPARAGREHHRLRLERRAALELHLDQLAGNERRGPLRVHHVDIVGGHVLFQPGGELVTLGLLHRDEILDADRIEQLPAQPLGGDAGADALARRIDRGRGAGGAAADHQHIVRALRREALGLALAHAAASSFATMSSSDMRPCPNGLTVQEHGRHGHDAAALDLGLKQRAVDHGVVHARIQHRHEIQRLNHVGTVLAAQRNEGLEAQLALERAAPDP